MDIVEFFELSVGRWFSQRTNHDLMQYQSTAGTANLEIEALPLMDAIVVQLCEQQAIDPASALYAIRVSRDKAVHQGQTVPNHAKILIPLKNSEDATAGRLIYETSNGSQKAMLGRYALGQDEALTLIAEDDNTYIEERLWFASPNLRLRTSLLKQADGFSSASLCSEIRMGVTKPADA